MHAFCIYSADKYAEKPVKITMSAGHNGKVTYFCCQKEGHYVRSCLQAESDLKQ